MIKQLANGRWQITVGYDRWSSLPTAVVTAILWRSYPTAQDAFLAIQTEFRALLAA